MKVLTEITDLLDMANSMEDDANNLDPILGDYVKTHRGPSGNPWVPHAYREVIRDFFKWYVEVKVGVRYDKGQDPDNP